MAKKPNTRDAVIALLESQLYDLKTEASPVSDFYVSREDRYRFDVTGDEIKRFQDHSITYRVCPKVTQVGTQMQATMRARR